MLKLRAPHQTQARGRVRTLLIDAKTGRILVRSFHRNIITNIGLGLWDTALFTSPPALITACKVGTGITDPTAADTGLTTLLASKSITSLDTANVTGTNPYIVVRTQFNETEAIGAITEAGLFTSAGAMFNHALVGSGSVTGATQANPCVITDADHGLADGQRIQFASVGGMTQLNFTGANYYYVDVLTSSTFALYSDATLVTAINSGAYGAYTSGGVWKTSIPNTATTILVVNFEIELANA